MNRPRSSPIKDSAVNHLMLGYLGKWVKRLPWLNYKISMFVERNERLARIMNWLPRYTKMRNEAIHRSLSRKETELYVFFPQKRTEQFRGAGDLMLEMPSKSTGTK